MDQRTQVGMLLVSSKCIFDGQLSSLNNLKRLIGIRMILIGIIRIHELVFINSIVGWVEIFFFRLFEGIKYILFFWRELNLNFVISKYICLKVGIIQLDVFICILFIEWRRRLFHIKCHSV